jgi:hypothetical protein
MNISSTPQQFVTSTISGDYLGLITLTSTTIGVFLNALTFLIFLRKRLNKTTMGFFYRAICAFLIIFHLNQVIRQSSILARNDIQMTIVGCKLSLYLTRTTFQMDSWLHVIMSIDRLIAIKYPNKFLFLTNRKFLLAIVLGLAIFLTFLNMGNAFLELRVTTTTQASTNTTTTTRVCTGTNLVLFVSDGISTMSRTVVPFFLMLLLDSCLVCTVFASRKKVNQTAQSRKEYQFAFSVLMFNFIFLILLLPIGLTLTIRIFVQASIIVGPSLALMNYLFSLTATIGAVYMASIFFITFFVNKLFREEFLLILKLITRSGSSNSIGNTSSLNKRSKATTHSINNK